MVIRAAKSRRMQMNKVQLYAKMLLTKYFYKATELNNVANNKFTHNIITRFYEFVNKK